MPQPVSSATSPLTAVRHRDYMLHHPPRQGRPKVETLLLAEVRDSTVVGIKMTLYRIGHDTGV